MSQFNIVPTNLSEDFVQEEFQEIIQEEVQEIVQEEVVMDP